MSNFKYSVSLTEGEINEIGESLKVYGFCTAFVYKGSKTLSEIIRWSSGHRVPVLQTKDREEYSEENAGRCAPSAEIKNWDNIPDEIVKGFNEIQNEGYGIYYRIVLDYDNRSKKYGVHAFAQDLD